MRFLFQAKWAPLFDADPGAGGGGSPGGEGGQEQPAKTFTQAEVDAMMDQRWKDSKIKEAELSEFAETLKEFGYTGTTSEIKAQLKEQADTRRKERELKQLQDEADEEDVSPALLAKIKKLEEEISGVKEDKKKQDDAAARQRAAEEAWNQQVTDFRTKHPDVDMDKLGDNAKFVRFLQRSNPATPLVEVYEDYLELVSEAERAAIAKISANSERSTSSGKGGGGDASGGTHGLNDHQQRLAKQNGMTNKEYAELLGQIKK